MARISGVDLPREKRVEIGLTYIYGIGRTTASKICADTNINPDTRVKDLTEEEVDVIRKYIDENHIMVEGDLVVSVTRTSSASWTSAAIVACVTARVFPSAASAPTPTLAPARVRSARSVPRRRNKERLTDGYC